MLNLLLLYCRAGFEGECAAEIQERAGELGVAGYCRAKSGSGYVEFIPYEEAAALALLTRLSFASLIFARQMLAACRVDELPPTDRITPLLAAWGDQSVGTVLVETADTNEAKELLALCRKFAKPFEQALRRRGVLHDDEALPRLHLFFLSSDSAFIGLSHPHNASPWFMGIPRLRFPHGAPSRSTLKLEEALLTLLDAGERERRLRPGMRAVDLGAAPGGWTWQLVQRHLHVTAVDNGPMDAALLDSGLVEHRREDGFRFRPAKPVDWLVCDMVEQPGRVAHLVGSWLAQGWCRDAIFNLKLPMKKRYQEVQRCAGIIDQLLGMAGVAYQLGFKQLYHDREEVTGYLRRV